MGKMMIVDDDGNTEEYDRFIAVGVKEDGGQETFIEDEGLAAGDVHGLIMSLVKIAAELVDALTPKEEEGNE